MDIKKIEPKKKEIKDTMRCPYCDSELKKWTPSSYSTWGGEIQYVCFNDECSYFIKGWEAMAEQGNICTYRLRYDPLTDSCDPFPVTNKNMGRDSIVE